VAHKNVGRRCFIRKWKHQWTNAETKDQIRRAKDPCGGEKEAEKSAEDGVKKRKGDVSSTARPSEAMVAGVTTALKSASGE